MIFFSIRSCCGRFPSCRRCGRKSLPPGKIEGERRLACWVFVFRFPCVPNYICVRMTNCRESLGLWPTLKPFKRILARMHHRRKVTSDMCRRRSNWSPSPSPPPNSSPWSRDVDFIVSNMICHLAGQGTRTALPVAWQMSVWFGGDQRSPESTGHSPLATCHLDMACRLCGLTHLVASVPWSITITSTSRSRWRAGP